MHPAGKVPSSELQFFYFTLEKAPDAVFWIDAKARLYRVNEAACRHLGYTREELHKLTVFDVDPNYNPQNWSKIISQVKQQRALTFETEHRSKSGKLIPVEVTSNHFEFNGEDYFCAFVRDITRRKLVEKMLQEQKEHQLELFFSQSLDGFFFMMLDEPIRWDDTVDKDKTLDWVFTHQRVTKVNNAMLQQYGSTREQFLGLTPSDLFSHDPQYGKSVWREFFDAGRLHIETDERKFDGSQIWIEGDYICFYDSEGRITGHFGIQRDVTERKKAEKEQERLRSEIEKHAAELEKRVAERTAKLAESEERLRAITGAMPDLVFVLSKDGRHLAVMTSQDDLIYNPDAAYRGETLHQIFPKDMADRFLGLVQKTLKTGKSQIIEYELPIRDHVRCFEARTAPLSKQLHGEDCVVWIARDITARKKAERALQDSEERLRAIGNALPDIVFVMDEEGRYHEILTSEKNLLYMEPEKLRGRFVHDVFPEETATQFINGIRRVTHTGQPESIEYQLRVPAGLRWFEGRMGAVNIRIDGKRCAVFIARDITDRKRAAELESQNIYLQEELRSEHNFGEIIGASSAMKQVFKNIEMVAATDSTVLLSGETGTGKELVARAIHDRSERSNKAMIKVNCGAMPSGLVESELFGHEKGAFTGATAQKRGKFELAHNGTIFLDEVGELPHDTQVKLLRVLQEQEFERVGGAESIKVDVRIIAATNRELQEEVERGAFRSDLFFRLNIFPIHVPPLRERGDDVSLLANYFISRFSRRMGKRITGINHKILENLMHYHWPGNVRELANIMERAVILCTGNVLQKEHIGELDDKNHQADDEMVTMEELERRHILRVLEKTNGVLAGPKGAAAILGMNRSTLWSRMQKLGISVSKQVSR